MATTPTAFDQYALELINHSRLNPLYYAQLYGIDLNQGLAPGTISAIPKMPLAINGYLIDAAKGHSEWMRETGIFDHTGINNSSPGDRIGATPYTAYAWGENIAARWGTNLGPETFSTAELIKGLFLSPGHRTNTMSENFTEIGIAQSIGINRSGYNSHYLTENFASSYTVNKTLTGVFYAEEYNKNGFLPDTDWFYTPGEGRGGVHVALQSLATTSNDAGGYSIVLPQEITGEQHISISGGGFAAPVYVAVSIGEESVKLDVVENYAIFEGIAVLSSASTTRLVDNSAKNLVLLGAAACGEGNSLDNVIYGNDQDNIISGKDGWDLLAGGGGADTFVFDSVFGSTLSPDSNINNIIDFTSGQDKLRLDTSIFSAFADKDAFLFTHFSANDRGVALDQDDYIILNTTNGDLFYDADGNGNGAGAVRFANLSGITMLQERDIELFNGTGGNTPPNNTPGNSSGTVIAAVHTPGFDENFYLQERLMLVQWKFPDIWQGKDIDYLRTTLAAEGMTPEEDYQKIGWQNGLDPNRWFNSNEYLLNKGSQLAAAGYCTDAYEGRELFYNAWEDSPWQHYLQYGAQEGIDPSSSFSSSAYLQSKLEQLMQNDPDQYRGWSTIDLLQAFTQLGLTPLGHYQEYGQYEGLSYQPGAEETGPIVQTEGVLTLHYSDFSGA